MPPIKKKEWHRRLAIAGCIFEKSHRTLKKMLQKVSQRFIVVSGAGLGPKYSVLRYFGTRVPILQYSSVLSTRTFKKYLYSYLYSSTFKNKSIFNEYLQVLYEY